MASDTNFYSKLMRNLKLSIHTIAPARVVSFNEETGTADIEILFMTCDEEGNVEKYPLIQGAPVLGMRLKTNSYTASISGITSSEGIVDGSNVTIQPKKEIEYVPFLKKDDVVIVGFAERAIDHLNGPKPFNPMYRRTHSLTDAIVLGVLF